MRRTVISEYRVVSSRLQKARSIFTVACLCLLGDWDAREKYLLVSAAFLCLHFFEEFGFPGGFPYMGVKILLGNSETDSTKWNCNNLNTMLSNWASLVLLYLLPLFLPGVRFLTIGAIVLSIGEIVMHLLLFNVRMKTFYNPGMITGLFGIGTTVIVYFVTAFDPSIYAWYDVVLGILYFFVSFWFCFRSPMYWRIGAKAGFPLTDRTAYGLELGKIR